MTNKTITPFCVDAKVENLSEEQIRQLHAWCLEAGATVDESIKDWLENSDEHYCMGVDDQNGTLCHEVTQYFDENVILFKDVRTHLGLDEDTKQPEDIRIPNPDEETPKTLNEIVSVDKNTLVEYANILQTDITVCQGGTYQVFMETLGEQDIVLKTDEELKEFVETYQKLMKFVD